MKIRYLLLALLTVLLPGFARAAWDVYGNAIVAVPYGQTSPSSMPDGSGGAFIAWQDQRSGVPNTDDIYIQRVNSAGAVQWTANGVPICTAPGLQATPQMTSDGAGGAIVMWSDGRNNATTGMDLYVQRIDAAGVVQWAADGVPVCTVTGDQKDHALIPDGAGGAFMVWADGRNPFGRDIYIQRVRAHGFMQWIANGDTLCTASQDQFEPLIVSDMAGGAIGIWRDWRNGQHGDIYAQRFDIDGIPQWATNGVTVRGTVDEDNPRAAVSDGAGGAIVISNDANKVHGQRLNPAGVVQWPANGVVICTHWAGETEPTAVPDGAGGAIVAWKDLRDPTGDIYAQRVSPAGALLWWPSGEWVAALQYAQLRPKAIADGNGGAIIAWYDLRTNVSYDVYAQRLDSAGDYQWAQNGVAITTRSADQKLPILAPDGAGGAIIAWEDVREFSGGIYYTDIYARRVSYGGSVITGVSTPTPALSLELGDAHPNPFSGETAFELRLSRATNVSIEVFDAAGRRVRAMKSAHHGAGMRTLRFDGRDDRARSLPSGVYFCRVRAAGETVTRKIVIAR